MSASFSNSTMPVPSSITSASRALVSKAPAGQRRQREREAEGGEEGSSGHARTPGRLRRAAASRTGIGATGARLSKSTFGCINLRLAAQRGNAHRRRRVRRCRGRRRPRWRGGSAGREPAGEERDDDLGAGRGVDDRGALRAAAGRGPPPRARRRRPARSRTAGALEAEGAGRGAVLEAEAERPAGRSPPPGRPQAASERDERAPAPGRPAAPSPPHAARLPSAPPRAM